MLYDKSQERDNCGFGLIAHIEGEPSHKVVRTAIHALARMQHRGAILADGKTGDGCGLLLQKPDRFFRMVAEERGWRLAKNYAVGMMFLSQNEEEARLSRRIVEEELQNETLSIVGWREVPTNPDVLGEIALSSLPRIEQIFVNAPAGWRPRDMERRLFVARRRIEKRVQDNSFYVCSFSNLVTIYKGLCMPADLPRFYLDLADLRLESAICLFHQRFSTNTVPRDRIKVCFTESIQTQIAAAEALPDAISRAAMTLVQSLLNGNKILCCGNGTSAANAQHFAASMINRFETERPSLPAIALNADNVVLTAISNDRLHDEVYAKQVRALGHTGDVLLAISTRGNSRDIVKAVEAAVTRDMTIVALTGYDGGELAGLLGQQDVEIRIPSHRSSRIQEMHMLTVNCLCDLIDNTLFPHQDD